MLDTHVTPKGQVVPFDLQEPLGDHAFFVLGIRKSGSSMLNNIVHAMADVNGVPFIDVGDIFFRNNVFVDDWIEDRTLSKILRSGHVFGGFRKFPGCFVDEPVFRSGKKILLVRDPRDALVSEFFSMAYSHGIPFGTGGENAFLLELRRQALSSSIDEFVLSQMPRLLHTVEPFAALRNMQDLITYRYEDVIFDKTTLIHGIADHFGWRCPESFMEDILKWADLRPDVEKPAEFVRKVRPGDHVEKLKPATIRKLNVTLHPIMEPFGYG